MNYRLRVVLALFGLATVAFLGIAQDPPAQPAGMEVLARGPVHEAFATPTAEPVAVCAAAS